MFDFRSFEFYRDNYNLTRWWVAFAVVASSVSIASLVVALVWWCECAQLWADHRDVPEGLYSVDLCRLH